jgi:hypothetical protein
MSKKLAGQKCSGGEISPHRRGNIVRSNYKFTERENSQKFSQKKCTAKNVFFSLYSGNRLGK